MQKRKSFYLVSALLKDSSDLGFVIKWGTEKEAIDHAKKVINKRTLEGRSPIEFYILKATTIVESKCAPTPTIVSRLK